MPKSSPGTDPSGRSGGQPRFVFFGGKGGVGKTTCAAAWAVGAARAGRGVLVLSTDPAHSLGDVIGTRLSPRIKTIRVPGHGRRELGAAELDGPGIFARWLAENRQALGDILEHGSWLERPDVEALLDLSLPGLDELVAMLEVLRYADRPGRRYDEIVIDTAPTGHTLRLFSSPRAVMAVASLLDDLEREQRVIRTQFGRVLRPEASDRLIASLGAHAERTAALLRDPARTSIRWVTLPEELALAETGRALDDLVHLDIRVSELIVNRVTPDGSSCPLCDERRTREQRVLKRAATTIGRTTVVRSVACASSEPRGVKALEAISGSLAGAGWRRSPRGRRSPGERRGRAVAGTHTASARTPAKSRAATGALRLVDGLRDARLLFVVGKGGVGKTTIAGTLALRLARLDSSRGVLLLSTDPAHSVGDLFDTEVGDREAPIPGASSNLLARELDAVAALAVSRAELEDAAAELGAAGGDAILTGGRAIADLLQLAPPGIDELFGLLTLIEAEGSDATREEGTSGRSRVDLIVVDAAPTGHALRLLEMPDSARRWLHAMLKLLLKYREVARPGRFAAELLRLARAVGTLQDLLHDRRHTRVIVVTRAGEVVRRETIRLIDRIRQLKLHVGLLVVNAMTLPQPGCAVCRATAAGEQRELDLLRRACRSHRPGCAIITTAIAEPPPIGVPALEKWARSWTRTS